MANRRLDKATPARALALKITREVRERDAYVRELVQTERASSRFPIEEFDFAQVLAFGVIMCVGTLDEAIDRSLNNPRDIRPKVRDALRISAYELLFLGKPAHVVVSQGVELVRHVTSRATGLANAVLRKMASDALEFPWGDPETDDDAFARLYGAPVWLVARLVEVYGRQEAAAILGACLKPAPRYLCDNPFVPDDSFASDLSAQHVADMVPLDAPILEIGAGRGTKTMLIESRAMRVLGYPVRIDAVDLHAYRADIIKNRMRDAGIEVVKVFAADARKLDSVSGLEPCYPTAFLDAPCSGTGTLRRHPEIRWHLTPRDVDELSSLQRGLLAEAATRVGPGGSLVYATCSILPEENQQVVDAFLAAQPENAWEQTGGFASLPEENGPDGHFAVVLKRRST